MVLTLLAFLFALGLIITFHEFGHYWVARLCGVRILRFSVGFGPILARRVDARGTEWALSCIPLGGYVKMLDEVPATADAQTRRGSYNHQPLWRRSAIVLGGPAANLVLAVLLYAIVGVMGVREPLPILAAPPPGTEAARAGLVDHDTVLAVNREPVASWPQLRRALLVPLMAHDPVELVVQQPDGAQRMLTLRATGADPSGSVDADPLAERGLQPLAPYPVLGELDPDGAAHQAGLREGDRILEAGGQPHPTPEAFVSLVRDHPAQAVPLRVERAGTVLALSVVPARLAGEGDAPIGRIGALVRAGQATVLIRAAPLQSVQDALRRTTQMSLFTLRMLGRMVAGTVSWQNVSGPVTIADYAGMTARAGLSAYLDFLALISISIGVLNLLPIPVLDGGHLVFHLLEFVRGGRPVPEAIRHVALQAGLALVAMLMFLALFNDFARLFR